MAANSTKPRRFVAPVRSPRAVPLPALLAAALLPASCAGIDRVSLSLSRSEVDIGFTGVSSIDRARALAAFGFEDIPLRSDGSFAGLHGGHVEGAFFGPAHREAAGMFRHNVNRITGSVGAVRRGVPASGATR